MSKRRKIVLSKKQLKKEYINNNLTMSQIAEKYKVCYATIHYWKDKYNIKKPTKLIYKNKDYSFMKGNHFGKGTSREQIMNRTKYYVPRKHSGSKYLFCADPSEPRELVKTYKNKDIKYECVKKISYAKYILKQAGIEIPKGYRVWHIDGNYKNNAIGNLKVVSLKEQMELMRNNRFKKIKRNNGKII